MIDRDHRGFGERFPALGQLRFWRRRRRIPVIQQLTTTECGAACLAMALGYHGKRVSLDEVRDLCGAGRDGASALALLDAATWHGLRGRGIRLEMEDLDCLPPASILHWEFKHFVVFEEVGRDAVDIIDPAIGRRRVPISEFRKAFTGVALLLEPSEAFAPSSAGTRSIWRHVRQIVSHSGEWSRVLVTSIMLQLFALAVPVLTGAIVDRVVPRHDLHLLLVLGAGMASLVVFLFLASFIRSVLLLHLRTYLDGRMTLGFLDHLMQLPYAFFQRRSAGDLMMRLNSNTTIREILTAGALSGVLDGSLVGLYLVIMFLVSPLMATVVLGLGALQLLVFVVSRRAQHDLNVKSLQVQARSQGYQVEIFAGIETLKTMGGERRAVENWSNLFVDTLNVSLDKGRLMALIDSVLSSLRQASPLIILGCGTTLVLDGSLALGTMLGLNALAAGFLGPLGNLVQTASQLQLLGSYIQRIDDVLDASPEQARGAVRQAHPLRGRIALAGVTFKYSPLAPLVVDGVSIDIAPGAWIAIVGKSGSGKSTLARLLVGLYPPTSGRVLYDGVDLTEIDLHSLRRQVGVVPQHPYLFGSSVRGNIGLSDPTLRLERIVEAARLACIHEDILDMPMGYDTLLADGGASLSGGQRQRLALARALVHQPAILFLDEATSALDAVTEERVQQSLRSLPCTRIVIAHRLSTIQTADLILVMDSGKVVEKGTHSELLAEDGTYAELVAAQLGT